MGVNHGGTGVDCPAKFSVQNGISCFPAIFLCFVISDEIFGSIVWKKNWDLYNINWSDLYLYCCPKIKTLRGSQKNWMLSPLPPPIPTTDLRHCRKSYVAPVGGIGLLVQRINIIVLCCVLTSSMFMSSNSLKFHRFSTCAILYKMCRTVHISLWRRLFWRKRSCADFICEPVRMIYKKWINIV